MDHSRDDRTKRVAKEYRRLVAEIARGFCTDPAEALGRLDEKFVDLEVYWLFPGGPDLLDDTDEWLSAPDLAHAIGKTRKDIYNWARRGHIVQRVGPDGTPEYRVGSVVAYQAKLTAQQMGIGDTGATA
jgi:hypothetical protein